MYEGGTLLEKVKDCWETVLNKSSSFLIVIRKSRSMLADIHTNT